MRRFCDVDVTVMFPAVSDCTPEVHYSCRENGYTKGTDSNPNKTNSIGTEKCAL